MDEGFEPNSVEAYRNTMSDLKAKGVRAKVMVGVYFSYGSAKLIHRRS